ncbi:MAG: hypothetical protein ACOY0T_37155 [Myxococcota bacterium]
MQTDALEHTQSEPTAESIILEELRRGAVVPADLKKRVGKRIRLTATQYKHVVDSLVAARRIHGRRKTNKRTIEAYALGEPPPAPPSPRELAPKQILKLLEDGPLHAAELKKRVKAQLSALAPKDYAAVLEQLTADRKIRARRKRNKDGKPAKTVDTYARASSPPVEFVAPMLAQWEAVRREASAAGFRDEQLVAALLDGLSREGVRMPSGIELRDPTLHRDFTPDDVLLGEPEPGDRDDVLRQLRELVARDGQGALIPIRKLRAALRLAKNRFDAAVLGLYGDDAIILHHHDYVGNLSDSERDELVVDQYGNYYVGAALRGES